jgi:hypothetical protein
MNEERDYAKITDVSKAFNESLSEFRKNVKDVPMNTEMLLFQAKFQLIIAQQLSIVAKHLGEIVRKAKEATE